MLEDMIKKLTEGEEKLNQLVEELKDKSYKAALMEGKYRKELAVEIEKLRTEGLPATLIHDLRRGHLAQLRYKRDIAQLDLDITREYIRNFRKQNEDLRTLISLEKEKMKLV